MADNVELDVMSGGAIVASDEVGGAQHQYVKVEYGADGAATPVTSSAPLPTSVISGTTAITGGVDVNTPGTITSGSIAVTAGTIGTVGAVAQIHNAGTIAGGTVGVLQNLTNGSIVVTDGTVKVVTPGTITSGSIAVTAGTVSVTTPGTITSGTVSINAGTIGAGTINTLGTVSNLLAGTIQSSGTVTGVGVVTSVGQVVTGTIANSGTTTGVGVVSSLTNVAGGTIKKNPRPSTNLLTIGSVWGTSSGTAGTVVAAPGASTVLMINDISIVNEGTTNLTAGMSFGTAQQGTTVLVRAAMAGNGGIEKSFPVAVGGSHPNLPLVAWTTGSGTASFVVSYWSEAQ